MTRNVLIGGERVEMSDEEYEEYTKTRSILQQARGVGYNTAEELIAEIGPTREAFLDAGVDGIASLDGWGEKRGEKIITQIKASRDGWSGSLELNIEYDPESEKQYTASFPAMRKRYRGHSINGAIEKLVERTTKHQFLDKVQD